MIRKSLAFSYGLAFAASTALVSVAFAQAAEPKEEVRVIAPYLVQKKEVKGPNMSTKVMELSTEREVSYSDLDLSNPGDAAKLKDRITDAARQACAQLDKEYSPTVYIPVSDSSSCARDATNEAMAMAQQIIDASKKRG